MTGEKWESPCGRVVLYCGDCLEVLPTIGKVDAVVTDPPYGIGASSMSLGKWRTSRLQKSDWDESRPDVGLIVQNMSVPSVVWGAEAELAWCSVDGNARVLSYDPLAKGDYRTKEHPTQKPVAVMEFSLEQVDGETVADLFMGSGTTGVAAVKLGRRFIGIEKEPVYFVIAKRRIMNALGMEVSVNGVRQRRMFT